MTTQEKTAAIAPMWALIAVPALIFVMGTIADITLNSAIDGPFAERFLPEICGLTIGVLTVLTFARRRAAYLAAGAIFVLVEMVVITLDLPLAVRAAVGAGALVTTAACVAVAIFGPWATLAAAPARQRSR